ncbi:MAG TPA: ABC transporter permease [Pseudolysinimonas sp.]|jgi:putative ABC transport system permease protein|nr:ABC transporter permease [Pseudolysinimonas sp.]
MAPETWIATLVAVLALAGIATVVLAAVRVPQPWAVPAAVLRAALQLAALSLILAGVLRDGLWVGVGLVVMFIAAAGTAAFRARVAFRGATLLALSMVAGPLVAGSIVFLSGSLSFEPRYVLAVGGIVIGNTMTIAILTQRILTSSIRDSWHEVEGWLALGATPAQSTIHLARAAIRTALLPSIDQTRTTGIVVLPGAFVGAVFAGASPLEAGRFQLIVLASILTAGVITAALVARQAGAVRQRPLDRPGA